MAKAKAICRCKSCGNEFNYVAFKYNSRAARDFEKWASENIDECPDCREKRIAAEREEQTRISAEAAQSKGWPELTGTEKQVAWATRIREEGISDAVEECMRHLKARYPEAYKIAMAAIDRLVSTRTKASWWIDNKNLLRVALNDIILDMQEDHQPRDPAPAGKTDAATVAKPESQTHDGIVDIVASDARVSAMYPKNDDFRSIVKGLGYRWDGSEMAWCLSINFSTGTAAERAAELGNKLLNAGFSIRIQDADTLSNAIEGRYEPMCQRWISKNLKSGKFVISWGRGDDLYDKAKRLPGARYMSPSIHVPAKEWESVMDFAETYGFKLSPGAKALVDEMRGSTVTVKPAAGKDPEYDEHPVADILNSSRDIISDLKD